jgi:YgiT-type zinc finger domain-containing protein
MTCQVCGGPLESRVTDLPFTIGDSSVVIIRSLPVLECRECGYTDLEPETMLRVHQLLATVDESAELKVVRYTDPDGVKAMTATNGHG